MSSPINTHTEYKINCSTDNSENSTDDYVKKTFNEQNIEKSVLAESFLNLDLSESFLEKNGLLEKISKLKDSILYLDLTTTKLSFEDLTSLGDFQKLEVLILRGNELKSIPEKKEIVKNFSKLCNLDILGNPIRTVDKNLQGIVRKLPYMSKWV